MTKYYKEILIPDGNGCESTTQFISADDEVNSLITEATNYSLRSAMKVVTEAIKNDPEYYYGWQANIAMAFKDAYDGAGDFEEVHEIANIAAKNFLDILTMNVD